MSDASSSLEQPAKSGIGKPVKWNPFLGIVLIILLFFTAPTLSALTISLINTGFVLEGPVLQFVYVLISEIVTISALIYYLRSRGAGLSDLGLNRFKLKHFGIGIAVYPVYFLLFLLSVVITTALIPALNVDQEQQLGFDNVQGIIALSVTFISLVILPPIIEELTVRGMIFTSLRSHFKLLPATLITSFLFAIAHLPGGGTGGPLYIAAIDTFVLSLVLCYVREKTDSLWPCITLHALKNGIAYFSLFIAPLIWTTL